MSNRLAHRTRILSLAAAGALGLIASSPAHALDTNAFGNRLKALYAEQGGTLAWTSIDESGSTIVLHGVTASAKDVSKPFSFGDVTLKGVSEAGDGGYHIDEASIPSYGFSKGDVAVSGTNMVIDGIDVPGPDVTDPVKHQMLYDAMRIDTMSVTSKGANVFQAKDIHGTLDRKDPKQYEFAGGIGSFATDLTQVPDSKRLTMLGYEKLNGTIDIHGTWALDQGKLIIDRYDIDVDNVGKLGLTVDIGGYTPAFIKSLKEMQASSSGQDNSAKGMAMLGLMQQLQLGGLSIRYDDASLTGKLLDFFAKQQHTTRDALVNEIKMMLPMMMAQLKNPDFASKVSQAVGTFLDDPKSIEIKAAPPSPVPMATIAMTGMSTPQSLPDTLGVTVSADQ